MSRIRVFALAAGLCACGPAVASPSGGSSGDGSTSSDAPSSPSTSAPHSSGSEDPTGEVSTTVEDPPWPEPDLGSDTGVGFIAERDSGWLECSTWEQDCPLGHKCVWHANDGGNAWNATQCVPVHPSSVDDGETCVYDGIATGIDNCRIGSICWDVDPETMEGTCRSHCIGSESHPMCPGNATCSISGDGFNLCVPTCDPLAQDCPSGQICVGMNWDFACAPETTEPAGLGELCEYINQCQAGLACVNPGSVPGCGGGAGCCSPYCEVGVGETCPYPEQSCVPWFEEGHAPGPDHIGVCAVSD